jgi:hypothetical protein
MKVFISQPMKDKTNEQIKLERNRAIAEVKRIYPDKDIEILDSFFENAPHEAKPLWFLGKSFEVLSNADVAYFIGAWKAYRGCKMEYEACKNYGIPTICE